MWNVERTGKRFLLKIEEIKKINLGWAQLALDDKSEKFEVERKSLKTDDFRFKMF